MAIFLKEVLPAPLSPPLLPSVPWLYLGNWIWWKFWNTHTHDSKPCHYGSCYQFAIFLTPRIPILRLMKFENFCLAATGITLSGAQMRGEDISGVGS